MSRGPQPQPTAMRKLRGNPGKRALNSAEPQAPVGAPEMPDFLSEEAGREWFRLCGELESMRLLHKTDRGMIAQYCEAWAEFKNAVTSLATEGLTVEGAHGGVVPNPLILIKNQASARLIKIADRFGLSPAARTRVHTEESHKEEDPLLVLMKSRAD